MADYNPDKNPKLRPKREVGPALPPSGLTYKQNVADEYGRLGAFGAARAALAPVGGMMQTAGEFGQGAAMKGVVEPAIAAAKGIYTFATGDAPDAAPPATAPALSQTLDKPSQPPAAPVSVAPAAPAPATAAANPAPATQNAATAYANANRPASYLPQMPTVDKPLPGAGVQTISSTPNGAVAGSGGGGATTNSPIIAQYDRMQAQKARDLELERQQIGVNAVRNSLDLASPYNTVGFARQLAGMGRVGNSILKSPSAITAQETSLGGANIAGQTQRDVTNMQGQNQSNVANIVGQTQRDVAGTEAGARTEVARTTADATSRNTATENAVKMKLGAGKARLEAAQADRAESGDIAGALGKETAPKVTINPNDVTGKGAYSAGPNGVEYVTPEGLQQKSATQLREGAMREADKVEPGVPFIYNGVRLVRDPKTNQIKPWIQATIPTTGVRG